MNSHLNRVGCKIQDLYVDLRDGKMLIKLLEVLSGERLVSPRNSEIGFLSFALLEFALPYITLCCCTVHYSHFTLLCLVIRYHFLSCLTWLCVALLYVTLYLASYIVVHCFALPYLTIPCIALPDLTLPHSMYITVYYLTLLYLT